MRTRTWAEIDLEALAHNFREVQRLVGAGVGVLAVVKADAYGHGAVPCARAFAALGAAMLGVACAEEATELRRAGIRTPILILSCVLPDEVDEILAADAAVNVSDLETARAMSAVATGRGATLAVHLKVDTGMGRQGVWADQAAATAHAVARLPGLRLDGIFTHFASADDPAEVDFTMAQVDDFVAVLRELEASGLAIPLRHCANSPAILNYPAAYFNLVRPGLMLYGARYCQAAPDGATLRPVMTLKSRVTLVKAVAPGQTLSYGRTFTATRQMRVAVIPAGYADGLDRRLSNRGWALVRGRRVPIVGRVCMDQTLLDVTDVPEVMTGDEVVLYGEQSGQRIPIEEVAALLETVPNEVMCAVSRRVPRIYVGGQAPPGDG